VQVSGVRIAVVGDYRPDSETHPATTKACEHAAAALRQRAEVAWVRTPDLARGAVRLLEDFDGVWIAPGSPYESLDGALEAIRFARTSGLPLIGTCGGFQHVIIEYARNVLGFRDAQHAEYDPYASALFITALDCSLAGQTMSVELLTGTTAAAAYATATATERYYCNFGLNRDHLSALEAGGLTVSGVDHEGEVRIVELREHPFFVATLFVPQVGSTAQAPHPLVSAFMAAAHNSRIEQGISRGRARR
jgi:CTP synthase (UTP-ammonia lyase)